MGIGIGSRLGPYEILAPLGAGGMGEVYRARDTKLNREVAIKVLPESVASDPERLARFEREAHVLASLNHPNIASIYGLEDSTSVKALVLELVEGPTLQDRVEAGPIPVLETLRIAKQIAEALEAAHEKGIIHRDLKPANVKLNAEDQVKVLDFGLAKALDPPGSSAANLSVSPTMSIGTQAGVILGTAAYMAPEQARGLAVDKRADVWAFGVLLYEMLTGRRLFQGDTVSDTLAAVLRQEIRLEELPPGTPAAVRRMLSRCLERDRKQRLHDIGDARIEIEQGLSGSEEESLPRAGVAIPGEPASRRRIPWAVAASSLFASAFLSWLLLRQAPRSDHVLHAAIPPPAGTAFWLEQNGPGPAVISPDGKQIAFTAADGAGKVNLYVRSLETGEARLLAGAEGAQYPFWSPDTRSLGFFAAGKLKTIDAAGGPPLTLCAAAEGKGASWSPAGVIVFTPNATSPLFQISEKGGDPSALTRFDAKRGDDSHRHPRFLPDGRHLLYLARSQTSPNEGHAILAASLDGEAEKLVLRSPAAVQYASGRLLFLRETTLMARAFDAKRLVFTGDAVVLAERIFTPSIATGLGVFSASQTGLLLYQTARGELSTRLQWFGRDGKAADTVGEPGAYREVSFSRDEKQAAVSVRDPATGTHDLWIFDLTRGLRTRFTFDPGDDRAPVWSPDAATLVFSSNRKGHYDLYRKSLGGSSEEEPLFVSETDKFPVVWSADGKTLLFYESAKDTGIDIGILPMDSRKPEAFFKTKSTEFPDALSPDGRWLMYTSDESGQLEVYATSFPRPGRKWQISPTGGVWAFWSADGKEILYQGNDGMLTAVPVAARGEALDIGQAKPLFRVAGPLVGGPSFAPIADHSRVLAVSGGQEPSALLELVVNWPSRLRGAK